MKKIYSVLIASILSIFAFAQSPEMMSYQAVVRDAGDNLVTATTIGMQISILTDSINGTAVYVETHAPTTNINGLVSLEIGAGSNVVGTFNAINWSSGPYFIKTETDPTGGTSYTISGTKQLLSVPYALHAGNAYWDKLQDKVRFKGQVGVRGFPGVGDTLVDLAIYSLGDPFSEGTIRLKGTNNNGSYSQWTDLKSSYDGHITSSKFSIYTRDQGQMNENFVINSLGYTGIGVSSPVANFHIQNGGFSDLLIESTGSVEDASLWLKNPSKTWRLHGDQSDGNKFKIGLWTDYSEIGGSIDLQNALTIDTLGNVGIGTATPQSKLHIDNGFLSFTGAGSTQGIVSNIAPYGTLKFYCGPYTGNASNGYFFRESTVLGDVTSYNDLVRIAPHSTDVVRVGIGIMGAQRNLHVKDVMRLEPRSTAPANPSKGDIYMDDLSNKLMVYDGSVWQACW